MPVTSRAASDFVASLRSSVARAGIPRGYTLRPVDNVDKFLSGLDRAQWRHTLRIVHRHYRAFQRGRRGATLRKGRSMMKAKHDSVPALRVNVPDVRSTGLSYVMDGS